MEENNSEHGQIGRIKTMMDDKNAMGAMMDKLERVRLINPDFYEYAMSVVEKEPVRDCANCPSCETGIPIKSIPAEKCCVM